MFQMGNGTQIVMRVTVLSFVIIIMMQGSVFVNTKAIGHSLTNFAALSCICKIMETR